MEIKYINKSFPALKLSPTNRLGETPLHLAAVRGNYEVARVYHSERDH